jgi:hypothetical protein
MNKGSITERVARDTTVGWEVDVSGIAVISPLGEICEMSDGDDRIGPPFTLEEMEAHARLSAAAPELLAAFKQTLHHWRKEFVEFFGEEATLDFDKFTIVIAAQSVIAKAEGRV